MQNRSKSGKSKVRRFKINGSTWDSAIADAEGQLSRMDARSASLKKVIEDFKSLRDSGHPWPSGSIVRPTTST